MPHEIDYDKLGKSVADNLRAAPAPCSIGLTKDDAVALHQFVERLQKIEDKAWGIVVSVLVLGIVALLGAGVLAKFKGWIAP